MKKPSAIGKVIIAVIILFFLSFTFYTKVNPVSDTNTNIQSTPISATTTTPITTDEAYNYLKAHISELSPEKPVLGGMFYVTNFFLTDASSGIVTYEDGHVQYTAKVSFVKNNEGMLKVTSFTIQNESNQKPENL